MNYRWRAEWVAIGKRSAATPSSAQVATTAGPQPFVGYDREMSERWRSVMLVAGGYGRRDLQGSTLTDFE